MNTLSGSRRKNSSVIDLVTEAMWPSLSKGLQWKRSVNMQRETHVGSLIRGSTSGLSVMHTTPHRSEWVYTHTHNLRTWNDWLKYGWKFNIVKQFPFLAYDCDKITTVVYLGLEINSVSNMRNCVVCDSF